MMTLLLIIVSTLLCIVSTLLFSLDVTVTVTSMSCLFLLLLFLYFEPLSNCLIVLYHSHLAMIFKIDGIAIGPDGTVVSAWPIRYQNLMLIHLIQP
jgi:hypothetical protein